MVTVSYHTINGHIESAGCSTAGNIQYMQDAIGSNIQTVNFLNSVAISQRFAPYGTLVGQVNSQPQFGTDMRLGWIGSSGYRSTSMINAERYVRARHYSSSAIRWTTRDKFWPSQLPYAYVAGWPTVRRDPTGNYIDMSGECTRSIGASNTGNCCSPISKLDPKKLAKCMADVGYPNQETWINIILSGMNNVCNAPSYQSSSKICVKCVNEPGFGSMPSTCIPCEKAGGFTSQPFNPPFGPIPIPFSPLNQCTPYWGVLDNLKDCNSALNNKFDSSCGCRVVLCADQISSGSDGCSSVLHESIHCMNVLGSDRHDKKGSPKSDPHGILPGDPINAFSFCACCQFGGTDCRESSLFGDCPKT